MIGRGLQIQLNPEQSRAVEHGQGPLMVLAGAGSGKTRVLVHRIARLVERGVPPYRILAVTFTNKAAGEMRERLRQLLGGMADAMWIGTFHATCARLLRIHHEAAGLGRDFTIFDADDQIRLVTAILKELGLKDEVTPKTVLWAIDRAKNAGTDPVEGASPYLADYIGKVYPLYRESLARENAVDFNDLLLRVLELADDAEVGPRLAERFDHILVDECQDTNRVQYELVRKLVRRTRNLTVVGDDDQSIYSWRGAEPRNLLDFDRDFPDAEVVKLEQNYRSTQVILEAANAVIAHNADRHAKQLWTDRDGGEPILWEECDDDRSEADFLARGIAGLVAEEGREWGDFAILYRTHAQSRLIEEALRAHRIDYRIVGGVSFFQRKEIKDIRAYLRLVCNPASDSCFERVVNVPARGIGKTTVDRVRGHARAAGAMSLLDAARAASHGEVPSIKAAARKKLAEFVDIVDGLRQVVEAGASVSELIIQAVERSGYRERLELEASHESKDRLANLGELVNMASDFDDSTEGKGTLLDFEERISLASANDAEDGLGQTVTMMTIHAAKGLEFPIVFVAGLEDGLFPSLRGRDDADDRDSLEEERRLAYVAFTRARDRLILTSAKLRRQWAEVRVSQASRFVTEIPVECLAVRAVPERPPAAERLRRQQRPARQYDEFDQRTHHDDAVFDDVPAFDVFGGSDGGVSAGALVEHASFGTGRVIESRGSGRDQKLLIHFGSVGLKTILARFVDPAGGFN